MDICTWLKKKNNDNKSSSTTDNKDHNYVQDLILENSVSKETSLMLAGRGIHLPIFLPSQSVFYIYIIACMNASCNIVIKSCGGWIMLTVAVNFNACKLVCLILNHANNLNHINCGCMNVAFRYSHPN